MTCPGRDSTTPATRPLTDPTSAAVARLGEQLLDALSTARWDDGTLLVDVDRPVLVQRVVAPLLRSLPQLVDEMPCLLEHQQLGPWEPAGDPELVIRRCRACGGEQIAPVDALAPLHRRPRRQDVPTDWRNQ